MTGLLARARERAGADWRVPTRFILLGHARCGSTVVLRSLKRHPQVAMFGEIFHERELAARVNLPARLRSYRPDEDAARYLAEVIFPNRPHRTARARGFKMFYDYARANDAQQRAWSHLIADSELRVIHLVRRNLLESRVSLEIALRTGAWSRPLGALLPARAVEPFALSRHACEEYFSRITTARLWAAEAFAAHPLLTLEYEADICGDFAGAMARVFAFLGVPPRDAAPALERQRARAPAEQISNYEELRAHFRHTLFERFFEPSAAAA